MRGRNGSGCGYRRKSARGFSERFWRRSGPLWGERWFRQEYLCEFVDSVSGVFERNLVEEAITGEFEPLRIL